MSIKTYFSSKNSYWLRWMGILPISIISYFIIYALYKASLLLIQWVGGYNEDDYNFLSLILPGICTGAASYYFITIGSVVSPMYKKAIALILFIVIILFAATGLFATISNGWKWASLCEVVGNLIGGYLGFSAIRNIDDSTAHN